VNKPGLTWLNTAPERISRPSWNGSPTSPKQNPARLQNDVGEFFAFAELKSSAESRSVTRAHVIAWRKDLKGRQLADTAIRRKVSALSSLFDYPCKRNAVADLRSPAESSRTKPFPVASRR